MKPLGMSLLPALLVACSSGVPRDSAAPRPAVVNHVVLFKLLDPADTPALLADCDRHLPHIPGVVSYFGGRHVETGRATVETGYDAAIYVGFPTLADYAGYVSHPDHVRLVDTWRPRLEWLRVYDVLDESP